MMGCADKKWTKLLLQRATFKENYTTRSTCAFQCGDEFRYFGLLNG